MSQLRRKAVKWARTLHIYVSLVGFLMFGFFAVTGILLNHESFGWDQMSTASSRTKIDAAIARNGAQEGVITALRAVTHTSLPATRYNARREDIEVTFNGPGRHTQALVNRASGEVELTVETRGWAGALADLHKGAETGAAWKLILDFVSVLMVLSSITGLIILLSLPHRRGLGLFATAAGTVATLVAYLLWVPR